MIALRLHAPPYVRPVAKGLAAMLLRAVRGEPDAPGDARPMRPDDEHVIYTGLSCNQLGLTAEEMLRLHLGSRW
jgi:hypothetical protein